MAGTTPRTGLPYPTGTDRVADGDNAMQALAERIEARYPRGSLGFVHITASQGPIGGDNTITSFTIPDPGVGRRVRLSMFGTVTCTVASATFISVFAEGATQLGRSDTLTHVTANTGVTAVLEVIVQPTAGPHTYLLKCSVSAGQGTLFATVDRPAFILAEDIGPVSLASVLADDPEVAP